MGRSFRSLAERMDPVDPPTRLRGMATDDASFYRTKDGDESDTATVRDAMARYTDEPVGLLNQAEKGLAQVFRWRPGERPSVREMAERHDGPDASAHKLLVYNTWLMDGFGPFGEAPMIAERVEEIGERIAQDGYDIVGLCEAFDDEEQDTITEKIKAEHDSWQWRAGQDNDIKSDGLYTATMGPGRRIVDTTREEFDEQGVFPDKHASKGILHTEIDLAPRSGERMRIDFYVSHTQADYEGEYNESYRSRQLDQLAEFVDRTRDSRNVAIVGGDLNVPYRTVEYADLLERFDRTGGDGDLGLEDVWLTRGGVAGSTHDIDDYWVVCTFDEEHSPDDPGYNYCDDYAEHEGDHPGASTDDVPGYRLDYVFVEKPTDAHSFDLDVARMRRRPFWRPGYDETTFAHDDGDVPHFLSDHLGLELELIASPR